MTNKQKLKTKADKLWFQKGMEGLADDFDVVKCQICDDNAYCLHHFYYKSNYGHLRYDFDNAVPLCKKHHFLLHHQDPKKIEDMIIQERGKKWFNRLKKKAYQRPKSSYLTIKYYEDIIKKLNEPNLS